MCLRDEEKAPSEALTDDAWLYFKIFHIRESANWL